MSKTKRTKKVVIEAVTLEQAQEASERYANTSNELAALEAEMNKKLNDIKSDYQDKITELQEAQKAPVEILEIYAKEQKEAWGKKRSLELLHCVIGFRTGTPKVVKDKKFTWDGVLELMKKNKLFKPYVRSKDEINKEAILALKDEKLLSSLKDECFISIDQDDTFFVKAKEEELQPA